ncbi:MAG: hypothetical protein LBQ73_00425 [Tannerellaceae bacterium]|jgi:hypothetical protein|nr:hypothetical protein [Tannerellaceae bacterium]
MNLKLLLLPGVLLMNIHAFQIAAQAVHSQPGIPGYVDSTQLRCYEQMSPVRFNPRYMYVTGANRQNEAPVTPANTGSDNGPLYDFQIPLVGDLDGDGKPEIVAIGTSGGGLNPQAKCIYIFNGQTGKIMHQEALPANWAMGAAGHHDSPGRMVLVDSDRNGKPEIVIAMGQGGPVNYQKRLVSYEVTHVSGRWYLHEKWVSSTRYDAYGSYQQSYHNTNGRYAKPVLQVLDIDGDGVPEILAYNKIYNAVNGKLLLTMEDLDKDAYVGCNTKAPHNDHQIAFGYFYDLDRDGKFEFCAGGKVYYDLNLKSGTYRVLNANSFGISIPDGHTAVADINADGQPEIVVAYLTTRTNIRIDVWTPNMNGGYPTHNATVDIPCSASGNGSHSYIYIADIDGRSQNGKKFPEISILGPNLYRNGDLWSGYDRHPNVMSLMGYSYSRTPGRINGRQTEGLIVSFTWDDNAYSVNNRLKVSFMMEHSDVSVNTGFTLFDFDNDGMADICYRDEISLRIISATEPFVSWTDTHLSKPNVIRFTSDVSSYTGFEYPVVADLNDDSSADMIVTGKERYNEISVAYLYAVESDQRNFAPTLKVWNQFMYSPLRINEDLTTPNKNLHPLSEELAFLKKYKGESTPTKTYIFNNTLSQVPRFSLFDSNGQKVMEPIVMTPDAVIKDLTINTKSSTPMLTFMLKNEGDASLQATNRISIYKNYISGSTLLKTILVGSSITRANESVAPGTSAYYAVPLSPADLAHTLIVSVSDMADNGVKDCNWADNIDSTATILLRADAFTLMPYQTGLIDVLANDVLDVFDGSLTLANSMITTPKGPGSNPDNLSGDFGVVSVVNNKIRYTAPASYSNPKDKTSGIVTLTYTLTYTPPQGQAFSRSANVYIHIPEGCQGSLVTCESKGAYNVCLKTSEPAGLNYTWYASNDPKSTPLSAPPVLNNPKAGRYTYYVKPDLSRVASASYASYKKINFPLGEVNVTVLPQTAQPVLMRWTGIVDTEWNNPANWVEVKNGFETPVIWPPVGCVNVIISGQAPHYPELTHPAACINIQLEDQAMIKNTHLLTYDNAAVEIKLKPAEKDRFITWSAPLKSMYSGDYHYEGMNGQPRWGDVYMNFFQHANPAGGAAQANMLTATFGQPDASLELGKAFNLKVSHNTANKEKSFLFPKKAATYTGSDNKTYPASGTLSRKDGSKFITHGVSLNPDNTFNLPVHGGSGYTLVQVVNPYMAYLNTTEFLKANKDLLVDGYKVWSGHVSDDFIDILYNHDPGYKQGMRYKISTSAFPAGTGDYIPPLHSFFVAKKKTGEDVKTLKMSPSWTTTAIPSAPVVTKASAPSSPGENEGILRIKATQGGNTSYAVLHYQGEKPLVSSMPKLFYNVLPLSLYLLSPSQEPLAIYSGFDYTKNIALGLRTKESQPITLDFSHNTGFGYNIYLIDREDNGQTREINLQKSPTYTFTPGKSPDKEYLVTENRFSLRFKSRQTGVSPVEAETARLQVSVQNGYIHVESASGLIDELRIFNLIGSPVYDSHIPSRSYRIRIEGSGIYIIRAKMGEIYEIRKIFYAN